MTGTPLEDQILENLYFVEPFQNLSEQINEPEETLINALFSLIDKNWIQPMVQDPKTHEYFKTHDFNPDTPEMYYYLATKEGLLAHNSR